MKTRSLMGRRGLKCLLVAMALMSHARARAMDRWAALSALESNNNDNALGAAGEVSRYQMRPEVWRRYASPKADWRNPADALAVAKEIMQQRSAEFERLHSRPPTDLEFYILWNAPAQIQHPAKSVRQRAQRFCNLVASPLPAAASGAAAAPSRDTAATK